VTLDPDALIRDAAALVAVPSVTGDERAALELLAEQAAALGLEAHVDAHDLEALRAHPGHPGEEAPRAELYGLRVVLPGPPDAPRLCVNGHVDVVGPGAEEWRRRPFSGAVEDGRLHGRGSVDMKGAVVAALHALAAARGSASCEVVLQAVSSEEDGGLGTFAALEADSAFDACLIPEPTGFDVVCAQAGALTFAGEVRGRSAHAAVRLSGASAVDAYLPVHAALAAHELRLNSEVDHPLMSALELPYPVSVGRIDAGEWSSSVPDRLRFQGRLGVRVGETLEEAEAGLRAALAPFDVELTFDGGRFASGETPVDHPFAALVREAATEATGRQVSFTGVPYGADMRQFTARGIPCVMCGTPGLDRAHATDEYAETKDLTTLSNLIKGVIDRFGPKD
jgi:acetylornithine deacetylase